MNNKCYCLEIFRKKYGDHVQGNCLKLSCGRYRIELRKEKQNDRTTIVRNPTANVLRTRIQD